VNHNLLVVEVMLFYIATSDASDAAFAAAPQGF
jgi:hypothetical protein